MIQVWDNRPKNHSSLRTLPELASNGFEDLQDFFKLYVDRSQGLDGVNPGEYYYKLIGFSIDTGNAEVRVFAQDAEQNAIAYQHWNGAPIPETIPHPPYFTSAIVGMISNGSVGFAYGRDSHINENGGPFYVWVTDDHPLTAGSDMVGAIGWWDDHITPNPVFKRVQKTVPSNPVPDYGYDLAIAVNGEIVASVRFEALNGDLDTLYQLVLMKDDQPVRRIKLE